MQSGGAWLGGWVGSHPSLAAFSSTKCNSREMIGQCTVVSWLVMLYTEGDGLSGTLD